MRKFCLSIIFLPVVQYKLNKGMGGILSMEEKLNIRYHNPNTKDETLKYITNIFIAASKVKLESVLQEAAMQNSIKRGIP